MSGPPRVKSMSFVESDARPVLGPAGNKARSVESRKPIVKPKSEETKGPQSVDESKGKTSPAALQSLDSKKIVSLESCRENRSTAVSVLRQRQRQPNLSLNASCSSDVSSDSSHSRASTGRISGRSGTQTPPLKRKKQYIPKVEKIENGGNGKIVGADRVCDAVKKRCAWVTSNTDPLYAAFHDEEWGLPVHDDNKLFELLSLSTALSELSWPVILSKRHIFRDVFLDFDPIAVSKLNDKKITTPGGPASSLLSEVKLRGIIENARQICKIIDEVGSFDKYIWASVNYNPIVNNFRYPRQVPIKTSKADAISKDLVRRGFRGVGPTVVYSFMQVSGITNDHLIGCFRHHDCVVACDLSGKNEAKSPKDIIELELIRDIEDMSVSK